MKIDIRTNKKEGETTLFTRLRIGGKSEHINLQLKVGSDQSSEFLCLGCHI